MGNTYTQHYSNFIGVDMSSDPRAVSRNRLAYAKNMWRDYESEQGEAIETFPGFRRLVRGLGAVRGLFSYRSKNGMDYLIVHAGKRLYSFESETVAAMDDVYLTEKAALENVTLEDSVSTAFIFNNNLYVLDGKHFIVVSSVTDKSGATSVTASEIDAYIPTTYFDGKPLEQRNMLRDEAYEKTTAESYEEAKSRPWHYFYSYDLVNGAISGFNRVYKGTNVYVKGSPDYPLKFDMRSFENEKGIRSVEGFSIDAEVVFREKSFKGCEFLETITLNIAVNDHGTAYIEVEKEAFAGCEKLKKITINLKGQGTWIKFLSSEDKTYSEIVDHKTISNGITNVPDGIEIILNTGVEYHFEDYYYLSVKPFDFAENVIEVRRNYDQKSIHFIYSVEDVKINGEFVSRVKEVLLVKTELEYLKDPEDTDGEKLLSDITILYDLYPLHYSTIENVKNFHDGNPDYEGTGVEAINGCTKSAVFDGRIFLTGNPALPNTVFYSNRNPTGANDPTYWGAYNYFNDGDGNTPNVDLLSTPSMLMVLKNNTVQDGSVYYHVGEFNTHEDEIIRNLVPRIYPSTSGAAGLGSAGKTVPGTTACNFLDDPVFLSTRGLEAVGKQTVNLERTITHRSGNVDRLLIKEDLSRASLAEWKGYLVICCDGRFYLADSRQIHQHADGSYQYEWYYLEGLGCYEHYSGGYEYLREWPAIDDDGTPLSFCVLQDGRSLGEVFALVSNNGMIFNDNIDNVMTVTAIKPNGETFYFYYDKAFNPPLALIDVDEERTGHGEFYPADKIVVVGERLFFGDEGGDVCVINTDKRGVPDYEGQIFESNRISSRWYSFEGVRYPSICVTTLDDCSKPSLAKGTIPGTAVARFKMMPDSHCRVDVSINGRDFKKIGEAFSSRYDAGDMRFGNFAFAENEDERLVLRELTRNWVDKQYLFISEGFREPFGLYEVSYHYTVKGKIRRTFALIDRKEP